jgi:hypothetical protein
MTVAGTLPCRLIYRGGPPVHWTGGPSRFGVQDRDNGLIVPTVRDDAAVFDFALVLRTGSDGQPDFGGAYVHGPRGGRFVYLSWRNADGAYAQRFKFMLGTITAELIARAQAEGRPIIGTVTIAEQRATTTGANVGGTRPIVWG